MNNKESLRPHCLIKRMDIEILHNLNRRSDFARRLSDELGSYYSTIYDSLKWLEKNGFIELEFNEWRNYKKWYMITEKGKRLLELFE